MMVPKEVIEKNEREQLNMFTAGDDHARLSRR